MTMEVMTIVVMPVIGLLITVLLAVLAFMGQRLHAKVDDIPDQLANINKTLYAIEADLRRDLSDHESRIKVVETKINFLHPGSYQ